MVRKIREKREVDQDEGMKKLDKEGVKKSESRVKGQAAEPALHPCFAHFV